MKPQKSPYLYRDLTAIVLLIAGIVMAFIALFLPPPGEIHESVLFIFAQILIYAGSIFGIDAYIRKAVNQHNRHEPFEDLPDDYPRGNRDNRSNNPPTD